VRTLYVAISAHGYGHIAQTAPVVNALHERVPALRIVVECAVPRRILDRRFLVPFEHVPAGSDFGMVMKNALETDAPVSHARYVAAHQALDAMVAEGRERLERHGADLLLANVPYVPLMAARRAGVPAVAMCSLNWAAIYGALCGDMPGARAIYEAMLAAYRGADAFLVLEPGMDMRELDNRRPVGPVAAVGRRDRRLLEASLALAAGERVVLVSMGGIATDMPLGRWPVVPGIRWVLAGAAPADRADMVALADVGLPFFDVLCSSDALVTKPGYGAFVEAACNAVPVVYAPRTAWPEAPFLTRWLTARGRCVELGFEALFGDALAGRLAALWRQPTRAAVAPTGVDEAAALIAALLGPRPPSAPPGSPDDGV
jgi:hypothetical protein